MIPILKCRLLWFPELVNRSSRGPILLPKPSPSFPSYLLQCLSSPPGDRAQASRLSRWVDSLAGGFILQLYPHRAPPRYTSSFPTSAPTSPLFVLFSLPSLSAKKKNCLRYAFALIVFPKWASRSQQDYMWGLPILCCWDCPVHARTFSSIPGFHLLDASSTHTPPPPR